jgi:hypothetical protein
MNVGGLILGIHTQLGVTTWQHDTNYFLYDMEGPALSQKMLSYAGASVRDNALILSSSMFAGDVKVFVHSTSAQLKNIDRDGWLEEVIGTVSPSLYFVFIKKTGKLITLIHRSNPHAKSRFFSWENRPGGSQELVFTPELVGLLCRPVIEPPPGLASSQEGFPFSIKLCED